MENGRFPIKLFNNSQRHMPQSQCAIRLGVNHFAQGGRLGSGQAVRLTRVRASRSLETMSNDIGDER